MSAYSERIARGLARGLTKLQASGKAPVKGGGIVHRSGYDTRKSGTIFVSGSQRDAKGNTRDRKIDVPVTPKQRNKYVAFVKAGKPETAKRYLLADVYGVPALAGGQYTAGWDYDNHSWFDAQSYPAPDLGIVDDGSLDGEDFDMQEAGYRDGNYEEYWDDIYGEDYYPEDGDDDTYAI